ncbi:hypothetical protein [Haladaptatus sp. DYF46]|uniref:hypothetical protein n=1 Tax=Haladaptatus sp. DYF46 TaxID=2886041 RepID=UPI001E410A63|nr:hypothetical protein [Haladaptatus sp. DYF46]
MSRKTDTPAAMGDSLRINLTTGKARKSKVAAVCNVFDANKSEAVLQACVYAAEMRGHNAVSPNMGLLEELMTAATERGSLTPEEIAEIISTEEVPVQAETTWAVGNEA